jgi:hypothetical protein
MTQSRGADLDEHFVLTRWREIQRLDDQRRAVGVGAGLALLVENGGAVLHGSDSALSRIESHAGSANL